MPLLDHFHAPLHPKEPWESFHTLWVSAMVISLNGRLPSLYRAVAQVHIGGRMEVDVATLKRESEPITGNGPGGVAVAAEVWAPPSPPLIAPATFPDEFEVLVRGGPTGDHLVAAIELVSPGNKDRPETRRAFAVKCASYLQAGVGLVIVDIVTSSQANLHDELIQLLQLPSKYQFPGGAEVYTVAYRPARRKAGDQIDLWPIPVTLGQPLPTVPLALRGGPTLPVDLEATYTDARTGSRL